MAGFPGLPLLGQGSVSHRADPASRRIPLAKGETDVVLGWSLTQGSCIDCDLLSLDVDNIITFRPDSVVGT